MFVKFHHIFIMAIAELEHPRRRNTFFMDKDALRRCKSTVFA